MTASTGTPVPRRYQQGGTQPGCQELAGQGATAADRQDHQQDGTDRQKGRHDFGVVGL